MRTMLSMLVIVFTLSTVMLAGPAHAENEKMFSETLTKAQKAFDSGKMLDARTALMEAMELISSLRSKQAEKFFPEAPKGFTAKLFEAPKLPGMPGSPIGTTVRKQYTREKDGAKFLVIYTFDSPQLANIFRMLQSTSGHEKVSINGMDAIFVNNQNTRDYKVSVSPSMMVSVQSTDLDMIDQNLLKKVAESINYMELKKQF